MSLDSPNLQLLDELSMETVNTMQVRNLCRTFPGESFQNTATLHFVPHFWTNIHYTGLIATSGLRVRIWTLLLIGNLSSAENVCEVDTPSQPCDEQHVLEADVIRTRGDIEEFRTSEYRQTVTNILQSFCLRHSIQYKQGMNEVSTGEFQARSTSLAAN